MKISSETPRVFNGQGKFAGGKQQQNAFLNASVVFLKCYVAVILRQALNTFKIVKIPSREVIWTAKPPAYPHPRPLIHPHHLVFSRSTGWGFAPLNVWTNHWLPFKIYTLFIIASFSAQAEHYRFRLDKNILVNIV